MTARAAGLAQPLPHLRELAVASGFVLLDQWGCLHDGERPHPGARPLLEALRAQRIPVALVSNSSRAAAPSQAILDEMGLGPHLYDAMLTAGEMGARWLVQAWQAGRVRRVWSLFGPPGPTSVVATLGMPVASSIHSADAIVVSGIHTDPPEQFRAILELGLERQLPLLCLNPDVRSVQPDGSFAWCPGAPAQLYAAMGGEVRAWGKPDGAIYQAARQALHDPPGRGLGVGDSLAHDVRGARDAGLHSVLIARGIHWRDLGLDAPGQWPSPEAVTTLGRQYDAPPTAFQACLRW